MSANLCPYGVLICCSLKNYSCFLFCWHRTWIIIIPFPSLYDTRLNTNAFYISDIIAEEKAYVCRKIRHCVTYVFNLVSGVPKASHKPGIILFCFIESGF